MSDLPGPSYFDERPERGAIIGPAGAGRPCDEPGPYATRCTMWPGHRYAHYDGSDDSSWTDRWRDERPDDDE